MSPVALEACGEVRMLPAEALPEEGVEIREAFREKKVRAREAEVHAGRIN